MKNIKIAMVCWLAGLLAFGIIPGTFFNYGWNYWQFLPWSISVAILTGIGVFLFLPNRICKLPPKAKGFIIIILPLAAASAFWLLRTKIHCFGGDGAVGTVPQGGICWRDFIPPMPGNRLDCYLIGVVGKICLALGLFGKSEVMPSILTTQIYTICVGTIFVAAASLLLRKETWLLAVLLTCPFIFNFFGNIDSYAFSLLIALVFMFVAMHVDKSKEIRFAQMVVLAMAWGVGLWTHPFHVFSGFIVAVEGTRFLRRYKLFSKLPRLALPILYGTSLFVAIKLSPWSNSFFTAAAGETPPSFSADTFTHYLNMFILPSVPIVVVSFLSRREIDRFDTKACISIIQSIVFFIMAFTLGAVDQFNYQHLLFFFLMPWIVFGGKELSANHLKLVVAANLILILPMMAVHCSTRTVDRAMSVYPLDPCKHNVIMSWQTHLGLVLGDNLQTEPIVKKACLRVFANGSRMANPPEFRGGNYIYHTAFLYHFGEFEEGRKELFGLLRQNPQLISSFLSVRPAFIYCNRERLWDDIELYLRTTNSPQVNDFKNIKDTLINKAASEPYYLRRPSYAQTDV